MSSVTVVSRALGTRVSYAVSSKVGDWKWMLSCKAL